MSKTASIKRRNFLKTMAATGLATGLSEAASSAQEPTAKVRKLKRDFINIGMVGLGPYSLAMDYTQAINEPSVPPRTNMKVRAVWGKDNDYLDSFRGSESWVNKQVEELRNRMNKNVFTSHLGVEHIVKHPEDMVPLVDAAFITDPEDSLNLARPFLEAGKPVFIGQPFAWSMNEAREIIRLAKTNNCMLVNSSCIPWMNEFRVAAMNINPGEVQHYYVAGSMANFCWYMPDMIETALKLTGGTVAKCSTYGVTWDADEDPLEIPPLMVNLEYEKTKAGRDSVLGAVSIWNGSPYRVWAKVHCDNKVVEQGILWEYTGGIAHDEHLWLPLLRVIDNAFITGVWPESEAELLNKVAVMLMSHKSGVERGRPVGIGEIENHKLPRKIKEKG